MAFATTDDVSARLGRNLEASEIDAVTFLLDAATASVTLEAGRTDAWAAALTPVPAMLRFVTVDVVCRALANPSGLASLQEQLGSASYSARFRDAGGGLELTPSERRIVRLAAGRAATGSVAVESILTPLYSLDEETIV